MTGPDDLLGLLRGKYSSLTIAFNDIHAPNYETAEEWSQTCSDYEGSRRALVDWPSEDERLKAIRENSVWTITWYPDTPLGFHCVGASTFEAAARYALEMEEGE